MEFVFETNYDQKGISAMAEALRKTIRKKKSKRTHISGWIIILLAILISIPSKGEEFVLKARMVITWIVVLIMAITLIFEDKINGYIAKKRMVTGLDKAKTIFKEDKYISETKIGKTEFYYENIKELAETKDYFVFVFDQSHAQIYDKKGISGGTEEEFKKFIVEKTGKSIETIGRKTNE